MTTKAFPDRNGISSKTACSSIGRRRAITAKLVGKNRNRTAVCTPTAGAAFLFRVCRMFRSTPAKENVSQDDLISGVDKGILINGRGSYSIDQQRYNFQFGGQTFWEIKNGKVAGMLRDVAYQSRTTDFWGALRRARRSSRHMRSRAHSTTARANPANRTPFRTDARVARFRNINVLNTASAPSAGQMEDDPLMLFTEQEAKASDREDSFVCEGRRRYRRMSAATSFRTRFAGNNILTSGTRAKRETRTLRFGSAASEVGVDQRSRRREPEGDGRAGGKDRAKCAGRSRIHADARQAEL